MGGLSWIHWVIIIGVLLVLFGGGGKISGVMGDFAKGIKAFKKGLNEEDQASSPPKNLETKNASTSAPEKEHV